MKKIYFLLVCLFFYFGLQAQVEKRIENTAGNLNSLLNSTELATITHLMITGTIDARDIKIMRDNMPELSVLDMGATHITAWKEELYNVLYPANTIPLSNPFLPSDYDYSFSDKTSLTSVILPASLTSIGAEAFRGCKGLISVEFPSSITTISEGAFKGCTSLRSVELPASLTSMGWEVFHNCSSLVSVNILSGISIIERSVFGECTAMKSIVFPSSVTDIREFAFYNCTSLETVEFSSSLVTIGGNSFSNCSSLTSVTIPSSVNTIGSHAFSGCGSLSKIVIPRTLKNLYMGAFFDCTNLTSIFVFHAHPLDLSYSNYNVFENVDKTKCILYVPEETRELYSSATQWKDFQNIIEMPIFTLTVTHLIMQADQPTSFFEIATNETWNVNSDQSWLSAAPLSGTGPRSITLTADNNTTTATRTAIVTIIVADSIFQDIRVIQKGIPVEVNVSQAGTLYAQLQEMAVNNISELVVTGEIDARDFKFIRDMMPALELIDLRGTTIKDYSGSDGTFYYSDTYNYPENEVPPFALEDGNNGKSKLTTVYLPETATSMGREALSYSRTLKEVILPPTLIRMDFRALGFCEGLTHIQIPPQTTTLDAQVFAGCISLTNLELPASITEIGMQAFEACNSLTSIILPPSITTIKKKTFYNCVGLVSVKIDTAVTLIEEEAFFNCINLESVILPPSIKIINNAAFAFCEAMTTLSIPASIESIGNNAFSECISLKSIYSYSEEPLLLAPNSQVFSGVDLENCILYVPAGTASQYASANQWKDFKNIVEMEEIYLSATTVVLEAAESSSAEISILSNANCSVGCDQAWVTAVITKGTTQHTLSFTSQANTTTMERSALVTVSAPGFASKIVKVIQRGLTVGIKDILPAIEQVKYYPNPFTREMAVEIANPSLSEVSAEIFSMSGQRIRILARALKGAKISLVWNGEDEQGQQVPVGVYLLKVNEQTRKVVKR